MSAIKVLRGCGASGVSLVAGTVYAVPDEVSEKDAAILVRLGKAAYAAEQPEQPDEQPAKRGKKADA